MPKLKRTAYVVVALAVSVGGLMQGPLSEMVHAFPVGGQVQTRAIRMSTSSPTAPASSVTYLLSFNPATSHTITGIVVDFCNAASTPIIGDATCSAPAGFSVGTPTVDASATAVSGTTFTQLGGTWTPTSANSARTLKMTSSGVAVTTGTTYAFAITTITNPSTTGTFYARFITYVGGTGAGTDYANYAPGTEGSTSATDYGGFALSTANVIQITAKVQESMTFCVSGVDPGPDCGTTGTAVTAPNLTIGHGPNLILDASAVDTAQAFTQLSTNAQGGANIRMKNTATSGGLNAGTNSIPPTGDAPVAIAAGTAAFGMRLADGTGGTGTLSGDANYEDATNYGMDATAGADNASVLSTYGDLILTSTAPLNNVENTLTFAATASNTTPAGLYTANISLIATGTF